jgi:hypothetical protein
MEGVVRKTSNNGRQEEASRPKLCRHYDDNDDDNECDYGDYRDDERPPLSIRLSMLPISAQNPAVLIQFLLPCSHSSSVTMSAVYCLFHSHPVQLIIH